MKPQSNLGQTILVEGKKNYSSREYNLVWIPTVSMRSYTTNEYNLNSDGNIMQMFHVLSDIADYCKTINVIIPNNIINIDEQLLRFFGLHEKIFFTGIDYGINIAKTREIFNNSNLLQEFVRNNFKDLPDLIIVSDFEVCFKNVPVVYRFNVTNDIWKDRQIMLGWEYPIFVLNKNQINVPVKQVQEHWFNSEVIKKLTDLESSEYILEKTLFLPFRLSDKDYHIDEIIQVAEKTGIKLLVTDPNDTISSINTTANIVVDKSLRNKFKLFAFLHKNSDNPNLVIPYLSDPTEVLHQSFLEMMTLCPYRLKFPWYLDQEKLVEYYNIAIMKKK